MLIIRVRAPLLSMSTRRCEKAATLVSSTSAAAVVVTDINHFSCSRSMSAAPDYAIGRLAPKQQQPARNVAGCSAVAVASVASANHSAEPPGELQMTQVDINSCHAGKVIARTRGRRSPGFFQRIRDVAIRRH